MSRIGKQPITIPSGVTVDVDKGVIKVKGKNGELSQRYQRKLVNVAVKDGQVVVERKSDAKVARASHGLYRALVANMIHGCEKSFSKKLEINGVGYSAKSAGSKLTLQIGFSHPVEIEMPKGIKVETPTNTQIVISGADKQVVGQVAADIRGVRPPEPYKGKGIKYDDETIRRKAGKTVAGK